MIESVELVVQKEGAPDRILDLTPGTIGIGRAEDNELVLADISVSRRHARLVFDDSGVRIEDLGSGNGIYFRGAQVQQRDLDDGDTVIIDPFVLKFRILAQSTEASPSPSAQHPRLLVTASDVLGPEAYVLAAGSTTIGRSDECGIALPDAAASRVHCRVECNTNGCQLIDQESANGIYVNNVRVESQWLNDGDEVRVGDTFFQFQAVQLNQAHSVTDQQMKLSESGEETSWSKELTLPAPDNRLVTDPRIQAGESSSKTMVVAVVVAILVLVVLLGLLVVLIALLFVLWSRQSMVALAGSENLLFAMLS